jgi:hypothetical protein
MFFYTWSGNRVYSVYISLENVSKVVKFIESSLSQALEEESKCFFRPPYHVENREGGSMGNLRINTEIGFMLFIF